MRARKTRTRVSRLDVDQAVEEVSGRVHWSSVLQVDGIQEPRCLRFATIDALIARTQLRTINTT